MTKVTQVTQRPLGNTNNQRSRSRSFCFTIFNYNDESYKVLKEKLHSTQATKWVIGKEVAPTTNKKHLQCFAKWPEAKSLKSRIELVSVGCVTGKAHVEECKGSDMQNYIYCTKDKPESDWEEFGFKKEKKPDALYLRHWSEHTYKAEDRYGIDGQIIRVVYKEWIHYFYNKMIAMGDYWDIEDREEKRKYVEYMEKFWHLHDTCDKCREQIPNPMIDRW